MRAHTVPKSNSLRQISRDGHVYSFVPSFENLRKNDGVLEPQLLGLNHASTFTGFCSKYDDSIFAPIEKEAFSSDLEQCFLLGYRAIAREVYAKNGQASLVEVYRASDRGKSRNEQIAIQSFMKLYEHGLRSGQQHSSEHKSRFDSILVDRNFGLARAYVIQLDQAPDVMCSGGVYPEKDFEGRKLQDTANLNRAPHLLTFTSFSSEGLGYVVFAWLSDSDETCERIIRSLDDPLDDQGSDALLRFFFEHCENVHLRPDWWEGLSRENRTAVVERMAISGNPFAPQNGRGLVDDGVRFPRWNITSRHCKGFTL